MNPVEFKNVSGEDCPPYAAIRLTGKLQNASTGYRVLFTVAKPNGDPTQVIAFNTNRTVASGEFGKAFPEPLCYAGIATVGDNGARYGIVEDEWQLNIDDSGAFVIVERADDGPNGENVALIDILVKI